MTTFEKREQAFEAKFIHDEELRFKATARCNKMLGDWAAAQLGLTGDAAASYARGLVAADVEGTAWATPCARWLRISRNRAFRSTRSPSGWTGFSMPRWRKPKRAASAFSGESAVRISSQKTRPARRCGRCGSRKPLKTGIFAPADRENT